MKFAINIIETLAKAVEVEAETSEMALDIVKCQYHDEVWVLDSGDFQEVEFLLIEKTNERISKYASESNYSNNIANH